MSTTHTGTHCPKRDKMALSESEARRICKNMQGMTYYKCAHCNLYHLATRADYKTKKYEPTKAKRKKNDVSGTNLADADVFEARTKDYDPNELVPAIPPDDYTGTMRDWLVGVSKFVKDLHNSKAVPLIRAADYARILHATEP